MAEESTENGRVKRIGRQVAGNYARSRYPQLRGNGAQKSAIPARLLAKRMILEIIREARKKDVLLE